MYKITCLIKEFKLLCLKNVGRTDCANSVGFFMTMAFPSSFHDITSEYLSS